MKLKKEHKKEHELNNIIEILNVKYNQRDILLNKQIYDEELDKEIEDMEKEKKELELIVLNKTNKKSEDNVIIKKRCFKEDKCWNENCIYDHPANWNPYDNKKECNFCIKGFCNKNNNKYKHIINMNEEKEILKTNGIEDIIENKKNTNFIDNINSEKIKIKDIIEDNKNLINKMEQDIEIYIEKIKTNIDNIEAKLHLNKILSEIRFFKYNYEDMIEFIINSET